MRRANFFTRVGNFLGDVGNAIKETVKKGVQQVKNFCSRWQDRDFLSLIFTIVLDMFFLGIGVNLIKLPSYLFVTMLSVEMLGVLLDKGKGLLVWPFLVGFALIVENTARCCSGASLVLADSNSFRDFGPGALLRLSGKALVMIKDGGIWLILKIRNRNNNVATSTAVLPNSNNSQNYLQLMEQIGANPSAPSNTLNNNNVIIGINNSRKETELPQNVKENNKVEDFIPQKFDDYDENNLEEQKVQSI